MKVDSGYGFGGLENAVQGARDAERLGYDGIWSAEAAHDPFFPLLLAAEHTDRIQLGTAIAVAFPRSPLHVAQVGWDLQAFSHGRLLLGLGSQVKAHIEKRYSATWSRPAARMREFILAMRAIWSAWNDGAELDFRGEFYTHTLMTPFFDPGPNPFGSPKVFLAAVGPKMTEVAGEVADGLIAHGFTTERYLREATLPALGRGLAEAGRTRADVEISCPVLIVTGDTDEEIARARKAVQEQVAFYASTPAYRAVLDLHGWGDLQPELNTLSKRGEWEEMGRRIGDDVLDAFAVVAAPDEVAKQLHLRYGDVLDRVSFYAPYSSEPDRWRAILDEIKRG